MGRQDMPDVVVLLPGIMGSVLSRDGREVWGPSRGALLRGLLSRGKNLDELALGDDSPTAADLGDGVAVDSIMPSPHVIPGLWKIDGYAGLREAVVRAFDVELGRNLIEFPYDWRRDNRAAAHRLSEAAPRWLDSWKRESGSPDPKLILIGHSMGGLVSRYFTEVLGGWKQTRALFTLGTPHRGSLNALDNLVTGVRKGPGGLIDASATTRTFTSVYQLLPTYACVATGQGIVKVAEAGAIDNLEPERVQAAAGFHTEIEQAVGRNKQEEAYARDYRVMPVVGFRQPTNQSARLDGSKVVMLEEHDGRDHGGDGTVPRVSATPLELSNDPRGDRVSTRHAALQDAAGVQEFLEGAIRDLYLDLGEFRRPGEPAARLSLRVEDAYEAGEPVELRLSADSDVHATLRVESAESGAVVAQEPLALTADAWRSHALPPLPPGAYRLTVAPPEGGEPAGDVFVVWSEQAAEEEAA